MPLTTHSEDEAYPPLEYWVYKSLEKECQAHLILGPRPDKCKPCYPMIKVNPAYLDHNIETGESSAFFNGKGKMVGIVCRDLPE